MRLFFNQLSRYVIFLYSCLLIDNANQYQYHLQLNKKFLYLPFLCVFTAGVGPEVGEEEGRWRRGGWTYGPLEVEKILGEGVAPLRDTSLSPLNLAGITLNRQVSACRDWTVDLSIYCSALHSFQLMPKNKVIDTQLHQVETSVM